MTTTYLETLWVDLNENTNLQFISVKLWYASAPMAAILNNELEQTVGVLDA